MGRHVSRGADGTFIDLLQGEEGNAITDRTQGHLSLLPQDIWPPPSADCFTNLLGPSSTVRAAACLYLSSPFFQLHPFNRRSLNPLQTQPRTTWSVSLCLGDMLVHWRIESHACSTRRHVPVASTAKTGPHSNADPSSYRRKLPSSDARTPSLQRTRRLGVASRAMSSRRRQRWLRSRPSLLSGLVWNFSNPRPSLHTKTPRPSGGCSRAPG